MIEFGKYLTKKGLHYAEEDVLESEKNGHLSYTYLNHYDGDCAWVRDV
ncbi:unnamed protein product [Strongylus vulgaris]|uniref:Uncharacterized protein n=1 Tax=Strongylus vulgaris TaxID=40348 RepID=A0A3P7K225_STRVU|nr:unnamed protein product [Strongylus vulgaris]